MRLTTKGRYAVTAMLDLALHAHSGPTSLSDISQRQEISLSHLEQLLLACAVQAWSTAYADRAAAICFRSHPRQLAFPR